ncbi:diguanylate cyclase (GGDEF)-like protein [Oxalobacteraceae bacterium GrIS 2.11]
MTHSNNDNLFHNIEVPARSILIVDELSPKVQLLQQIFAVEYQVFTADTIETALNILGANLLDLMLLDIDNQYLDGYELCRQLKANKSTAHVPVIFVTSFLDEEMELRGLAVGAVDFVTKPFDIRVIQARVKTHITLKLQTDLLQKMAFIDTMTGLYNRHFFDDRIESEFHRSRRTGSFLSLLLIDIDEFKSYTEHYGHLAGDECLRRIADCVRKCCKRPADFVARYSGSELICLLPDTSVNNAFPFAQNVEKQVREMAILHAHSAVADVATVSLGVVSRTGVEHSSVFIEMAKIALQRARDKGGARAWCALD